MRLSCHGSSTLVKLNSVRFAVTYVLHSVKDDALAASHASLSSADNSYHQVVHTSIAICAQSTEHNCMGVCSKSSSTFTGNIGLVHAWRLR